MKNAIFLVSLFCASMLESCYLWESYRDHERSCCLFINGVDYCNPYVPCTRNIAYDLTKLNDYLGRILQVDKGLTFSYHAALQQAQEFIKQALNARWNIAYRFDTPQRSVKFWHEIAEAARAIEKNSKPTAAAASTTTEKQNKEEAVLAYLMKLGLAWSLQK